MRSVQITSRKTDAKPVEKQFDSPEDFAEAKRRAHEHLMEAHHMFAVVYREQVRRVRILKEKLERAENGK